MAKNHKLTDDEIYLIVKALNEHFTPKEVYSSQREWNYANLACKFTKADSVTLRFEKKEGA